MDSLTLVSPLQGWITSLDEVPDPVFAGRLMGDGVAVDPTGSTLVAPCDGTIISIHSARHAIALRSHAGPELLIHLGVDSVALKGQGIEVLVAAGDVVTTGKLLLKFDLDVLVVNAKAAVTPLIVTNGGKVEEVLREGLIEAGQDLLRIRCSNDQSDGLNIEGTVLRRTVTVALQHGIHARPAARIVHAITGLDADAYLSREGKSASSSSTVAMLGLGVEHGDAVTIEARGTDADIALDRIQAILGDSSEAALPKLSQSLRVSDQAPGLRGVAASPGLAVGQAFRFTPTQAKSEEYFSGPDEEKARLERALDQVRNDLETAATSPGAVGQILNAHIALLQDPVHRQDALDAIDGGHPAGRAWSSAIAKQLEVISAAGSAHIAARGDDLRDIEARILQALAGKGPEKMDIPEASILIASDLLPSQIVALDSKKVIGIALANGGPTSHVAILAAGMGIPMAVAFGNALDAIKSGAVLALNGDLGTLEVEPEAERERHLRDVATDRKRALSEVSNELCHTAEGVRVRISANLGEQDDAHDAVERGAEGCGLLRTEFLFIDRASPPGEQEQRTRYQAIADALNDKPLTIRLLDIGGDKPVPYLQLDAEENPMLGVRGIRVLLAHRDLLRSQLAAILSVQSSGLSKIMIPMLSSVAEFDEVATEVEKIKAELGIATRIELGIMIETPAAALLASALARRADFFSIGSNDLTQYALAMDRGNPATADKLDGLDPAVLKLIAMACEAAQQAAIPVSVCGALAADHLAIPVLLGMGVTELSVPSKLVQATKNHVKTLTVEQCRAVATDVGKLASSAEVRARMTSFLGGEFR